MTEVFPVHVKGKGYPSAVGRQNADGTVTIRIDDDCDPAPWLELTIPAGQLRCLAAQLPSLLPELTGQR